jgi:hypothetical protein
MAFTFQSIGASIKKKVSQVSNDYKLKSERDAYYNSQKKAQQDVADATFRNELLKTRAVELDKQAKLRAHMVAKAQAKAKFTPGKSSAGFWSPSKIQQSNNFMGNLMGKPTKSFNVMSDLPFSNPTKKIEHKIVQHNAVQKPVTLNINGTSVTIGSAVKKKLLKNSIKKQRSPNQNVNDLIWKY